MCCIHRLNPQPKAGVQLTRWKDLEYAIAFLRGKMVVVYPKVTVLIFTGQLAMTVILVASSFNLVISANLGLLILGELVGVLVALWTFVTTIIFMRGT